MLLLLSNSLPTRALTHVLAHFHTGDPITSIHKSFDGGRWPGDATILHGTVSVLVLFMSKEDVTLS